MPINCRLSFSAATAVVSEPRRGSRTNRFCTVNFDIRNSASTNDCSHSCNIFSGGFDTMTSSVYWKIFGLSPFANQSNGSYFTFILTGCTVAEAPVNMTGNVHIYLRPDDI